MDINNTPPNFGEQPNYNNVPPNYNNVPPNFGGQPNYNNVPPNFGGQPNYNNVPPNFGGQSNYNNVPPNFGWQSNYDYKPRRSRPGVSPERFEIFWRFCVWLCHDLQCADVPELCKYLCCIHGSYDRFVYEFQYHAP